MDLREEGTTRLRVHGVASVLPPVIGQRVVLGVRVRQRRDHDRVRPWKRRRVGAVSKRRVWRQQQHVAQREQHEIHHRLTIAMGCKYKDRPRAPGCPYLRSKALRSFEGAADAAAELRHLNRQSLSK